MADPHQEERRFLHDLSNPVSTAMIAVDALAEELRQGRPGASPNVLKLAEHAREALDRAHRMMKERRALLGGGGES